MVNEIDELDVVATARLDPIRLVRMMKEIVGLSHVVLRSQSICFTHERARGGRGEVCLCMLAIQSASPTGKPVGVDAVWSTSFSVRTNAPQLPPTRKSRG